MARMHTGKQNRLTIEEKDLLKEFKQNERDKFESENMGKYMLLYPLSEKVKQTLKEQNKANELLKDEHEIIPDQSILNPQGVVINEIPFKKKEVTVVLKDTKIKLNRKKTIKEPEDDGDIYMKYLK